MSKNKKKLYTGIFITLCLAGLTAIVFFVYPKEKKSAIENIVQESSIPSPEIKNNTKTQTTSSAPAKTVTQKTENQKNIQENTQSVTVLAGATTAHLSFASNTTFYDALVQAKGAGQIDFAGKNYPGLGFFVTDIGTLRAIDGKSLLYYINGKQASVGVSSYTLKDGDIIEWKLE